MSHTALARAVSRRARKRGERQFAGKHYWRPVTSYCGRGWKASRVWCAWLRLQGRLVLTLRSGRYPQRVDRRLWPLVFDYGVWWIPARYFDAPARHPECGLPIPAHTEEYLSDRYGNWRRPRAQWEFYRDDGLYVEGARRPQHPVVLLQADS